MKTEFVKSSRKCISCASNCFVIIYKNQSSLTFENFEPLIFEQQLECCYDCGLVRQQDNKSYSDKNLSKYYKNTYRTPVNLETIAVDDSRKKNALKRLKFIKSLKEKGTLLEIGYGDGVFLDLANNRYDCVGIDPSKGYSIVNEFLESKGVSIYNCDFKRFRSTVKFEVICFFLVLEHIKNPLLFLSSTLKFLKPNGVLVIEVPDIKRYSNFNSETMLTHEHLYHYCINTLSALLGNINLELIEYSNKKISYGFSLLAAFRISKTKKNIIHSFSGFDSVLLFQDFLALREKYRKNLEYELTKIQNNISKRTLRLGIYGTGFLYSYAIEKCGLKNIDVEYLFDDTKEKIGTKLNNKEILPLSMIQEVHVDALIIFSEMFFGIMKNNVLRLTENRHIQIINIHQIAIA